MATFVNGVEQVRGARGRFFFPWLTCGAMYAGSSSGALAARRDLRAEAKRSVMVTSAVDDGLGSLCAPFSSSSSWRFDIFPFFSEHELF